MKILIVFLALSLIFGCLCGQSNVDPPLAGDINSTSSTQPVSNTVDDTVDKLFGLLDAVQSGASHKCNYTYDGVESEVWVKGNYYHSKSYFEDGVAVMMTDGEYIYTWIDGDVTGVKFNVSDVQDYSENTGQDYSYTDLIQVAKVAANVYCTPTVIDDTQFIEPSLVEFLDLTALLKIANQPQEENDLCNICSFITDESSRNECLQNC